MNDAHVKDDIQDVNVPESTHEKIAEPEPSAPPPQEESSFSDRQERTSSDQQGTAGVPAADENLAPESACVIDGSKLILRIAAPNKPFQVDHGVKILFSSGPLRRTERTLLFSTYVVENANTTVVIDSGGSGYRFVPLFPAATDGVLYTRDGSFHVVLSGAGVMQRSRVSAPSLPTRVVNKFVTQSHYQLKEGEIDQQTKAAEVLFPWSTLGSDLGEGGVVFVRSDESVFEHKLSQTKCELHDGRPIAWTKGVTFASSGGWFCFKRLNRVTGEGRLWLDNGKPATNPNVVIT